MFAAMITSIIAIVMMPAICFQIMVPLETETVDLTTFCPSLLYQMQEQT